MLLLLQLEQGVSRPKELSFGAKMQYHALGTQWEYTKLLIFSFSHFTDKIFAN